MLSSRRAVRRATITVGRQRQSSAKRACSSSTPTQSPHAHARTRTLAAGLARAHTHHHAAAFSPAGHRHRHEHAPPPPSSPDVAVRALERGPPSSVELRARTPLAKPTPASPAPWLCPAAASEPTILSPSPSIPLSLSVMRGRPVAPFLTAPVRSREVTGEGHVSVMPATDILTPHIIHMHSIHPRTQCTTRW